MSYLLGIDIGSSSIKSSIVDIKSRKSIVAAQSPAQEMPISSSFPGWAEQAPEMWWEHTQISIRQALSKSGIQGDQITAIGITYQMHGLVCLDKNLDVIRPSIIWCDSRAVSIGHKAFSDLGESYCLKHLLNSPGNFTASKLKWVKDNEPTNYDRIYKIILPGDYIAFCLTGQVCTTASGLSEGTFWDFRENSISKTLLKYYKLEETFIPEIVPTFSEQGRVTKNAAETIGLKIGTPVSYRAGDQPNNAFSLNVLNPGEMATTAGTSGVVYSVTDKNAFDTKSRVNTFIHVNDGSREKHKRNGILLCVNGTGILNSWTRKLTGTTELVSYESLNSMAAAVPIGAEGLSILPFGNGAERILENKEVGCHINGVDFNRHSLPHVARAVQEGIVFALKYGLEIIHEIGESARVIRAGNSNMFLSAVFREAFVNTTGVVLELYNTDGATGAAIGAGVGNGAYTSFEDALGGLDKLDVIEPENGKSDQYNTAYLKWQQLLKQRLS